METIEFQLDHYDINELLGVCVYARWDQNLKKRVIRILMHREVSKLNYKNLLNIILNNNKKTWKKLEKQISVKGKQVVHATISSTPASDFGIFEHLEKGQGINSNQRDSKHAINLWGTEVKTKDGKVLFSALRHGNTRGRNQATKEIILAAAYQKYGDALASIPSSADNPIELKLGNIQLMSPNWGLFAKFGDKKMPFDQMDTFKQYENKPFEIKIKGGKSIWLLVKKPILVNFGTNRQYYAMGGVFVSSSNKQNQKAFEELFGKHAMELAKTIYKQKGRKCRCQDLKLNETDFKDGQIYEWLKFKKSSKKAQTELTMPKQVIALSNQILYLWYSTNKRGKKSNPASIQIRLAVLMYLIGYAVSFNCKSGKDRTGEVAAEINNLVLTMEANNGEIPNPDAELTNKDKLQARNVLNATQSYLIAQANTGVRGLKVDYKETTKIFGGNLKGASGNVSG